MGQELQQLAYDPLAGHSGIEKTLVYPLATPLASFLLKYLHLLLDSLFH